MAVQQELGEDERPGDGRAQSSITHLMSCQQANGAFVASPDFAEYQYCWLRDASFVAYALDRGSAPGAAAAYHRWVIGVLGNGGIAAVIDEAIERLAARKPLEPTAMPPARFTLEGRVASDGWPNFQIDGYGTWLWAFSEHLRLAKRAPSPEELQSIERLGRYLAAFAFEPCFDVWEEYGDSVHTSTLASVFAGLTAAAELVGHRSFSERAAEVRARITTSARALGRLPKSSSSHEIDASALWCTVPFSVLSPDEPVMVATARAVEDELLFDGGIRRYPTDTYFGGGAWPVLTASLGLYHAAAGDLEAAARCRDQIRSRYDDAGRLGEQFGGELRDPSHHREWTERWGRSAQDLLWSHAMYVILCAEIAQHTER